MEKEYKCLDCGQGLVKKEKSIYECPDCQKVFVIRQGQLLPFSDDQESKINSKDKDDEIEEIDDDIQTLEMLDFFDDEFI